VNFDDLNTIYLMRADSDGFSERKVNHFFALKKVNSTFYLLVK